MLNKVRPIVEELLKFLNLDKIPVQPNTITLLAFVASACVPLLAILGVHPYIIAMVLLASASLDVLDGYVARKRRLQTSYGAFLDSTLDRVSDAMYTLALALTGIVDFAFAYTLLTCEYLVSYTRARAETLGVSLAGVGLMERGERTLFKFMCLIAAPTIILVAKILAFLLLVLTAVTAAQRIWTTKRALEGAYPAATGRL